MVRLMFKEIDPEAMPVLRAWRFTEEELARDFTVRGGEWRVEDGWLTGKNPLNAPGMVTANEPFCGDVLLDFEARTVLPSSHDINVMWNGSWDEAKNERSHGYVAGVQGWWHGKVGFEKSPGYALNAATPLFDFEPGRIYHIQAGSIEGHLFILLDGRLALELTDPDPLDGQTHGLVGFEAYASHIQIRNFMVRRAVWRPYATAYEGMA